MKKRRFKFRIGDRVAWTDSASIGGYSTYLQRDDLGTIVVADSSLLVEFDRNIRGHNGLLSQVGKTQKKKAKDGHGWWVLAREIRKVTPELEALIKLRK